jgi:hypothetical protein
MCALGVFVVLALPAGSGATTTWTTPRDISAAGHDSFKPQVVVDPSGNALAVWFRSGGPTVVQAAARPAGGTWQATQDISVDGQGARDPQVALDPSGNAVAVWYRSDGGSWIVQAAYRPAGGSWQAPENLSVPGQDAVLPKIAFDPVGNAIAVWQRRNGNNYIVQAAARPAGGAWETPLDLSTVGGDAVVPEVALDTAGNALAIWQRYNGSEYIVQAAGRPAGAEWEAPQDLSAVGHSADDAQVAFDSAGNGLAVWSRFNGSAYVVQAAERPAGGTWAAPQNLSVDPGGARGPQLAFDQAGNALVVWDAAGAGLNIVQALDRPAGGTWREPRDLSVFGQAAYHPEVAVDSAGNALVLWYRSNGSNSIVQAAARPAAGTWQAPQDLSVAGQDAFFPQVAFDSAGNAVAVWERFNGSNRIIQATQTGTPPPPPPPAPPAPPPPSRPSGCIVPRVVGKKLAGAKAALRRRHCRLGRLRRAYSPRLRRGRVLSQKPKPGRNLKRGARVNLVVSRGRRR